MNSLLDLGEVSRPQLGPELIEPDSATQGHILLARLVVLVLPEQLLVHAAEGLLAAGDEELGAAAVGAGQRRVSRRRDRRARVGRRLGQNTCESSDIGFHYIRS